MFKLLHTSDWHLGKKLFKADRISEQKKFLDWLLQTIIEHKIDYLLIAGDIFDSPHPPNEALKLYFDFLHALTQTKTKCFIISGNHDSGTFLEAPGKILSTQNIIVSGQLHQNLEQHIFKLPHPEKPDSYVGLVTLPYFRNFEIYNLGKSLGILENDDFAINTLKEFLRLCSEKLNGAEVKLLMSHHLFGMYSAAGSEVAISLSGIDSIPNSMVEGLYDYVALGHIHKPQIIKKDNPIIYYSGSPISMRFSETAPKSVSLITVDGKKVAQELISIPKFRELIQIDTTEEDLHIHLEKLKSFNTQGELKNFIEFLVHLKTPTQGLLEKIKEAVDEKNHEVLNINFIFDGDDDLEKELYAKISRGLSLEEMFDAFYQTKFKDQNGPTPELKEDFIDLMKRTHEDHL